MSILRNSLTNFSGGVLPALALVVTVPLLVAGLGLSNYGLLTLIGAITGYFSIIDINLTAGSTKFVSEYRALGDNKRESQTIILGLFFYLILGVLGAAGMFVFAGPLAATVFDIPVSQRAVATSALQLAALGFLIGQIQQYLNSLPQAIQRFDVSSKLETVFGVAVPVISVMVLPLGAGLLEMVEIRIAGSALHAVALAWWFPRLFPQFRLVVPTREVMARVMSFSSFAYLNKLASLTYAHADKLIIGSLLGMEAVTIYTVPATLINRFLGLTFRLSSVIFPAASHMAAIGDWERLRVVYLASSRYITFVNGVIVALSLLFGRELLYYWIGGDVAQHGWNVFVMIGLAMFVESLTNLPSLVNDGLGHARTSGLFAMSRAILGLLLTWALASTSGIDGVAAGHLLASVCIGAAFIFYAHGRTVPFSAAVYLRDGLVASLLFVGAPALLIWALRPQALLSLSHTLLLGTACGLLFAVIGLSAVVDKEDRSNFFLKLRKISLRQKQL